MAITPLVAALYFVPSLVRQGRSIHWQRVADHLGFRSEAARFSLFRRDGEMVLEGEKEGRIIEVHRRYYSWWKEEAVHIKERDRRAGFHNLATRRTEDAEALKTGWYVFTVTLGVGWLGVSLRPRELRVGDLEEGLEVRTGDPVFDEAYILFGRVGQSVVKAMGNEEAQRLLEEAPMAFEISQGKIHFYLHHRQMMETAEGEVEAILDELLAYTDRLDEVIRS